MTAQQRFFPLPHDGKAAETTLPGERAEADHGSALKWPHLAPAMAALVAAAVALVGFQFYARSVESEYIHALAPESFDIKNFGSALQVEAVRQPDLVPMFGSSELDSFVGPYTGSEFFRSYPTGFEVFPIGTKGTTPLIILQDLVAIGPELNGKKIILSASPTFVRGPGRVREDYYSGNFSRLHASELAFSTSLSFGLKQEVARRMMRYPRTLDQDGLLKLAVEKLADGSLPSRGLYLALLPLGKMHNVVLQLQDHWETVAYIQRQGLAPALPRRPERPDWQSLAILAEREAQRRSGNNPFGFDDDYWNEHGSWLIRQSGRNNDGTYLRSLHEELEWTDLELLLKTVQELGAQPLLLSVPIKGVYYDYWGVSPQAREQYYKKFRATVKPFGFPLLDYQEFDGDKYFMVDDRSHPSQKGWIYYDQAIDDFFHGRLRPAQEGRSRRGA